MFPFSLLFLKLAISYFGTKQKTLYIKFGYLSCRCPNINTFLNTTLIFCEFFVSFLFLPHAPKNKKRRKWVYPSLYQSRTGTWKDLTTMIKVNTTHSRHSAYVYIRAVGPLLYINKTGAPYSSARCGCEIFQVSSLGKAKCVNMYAGCFTTDNANITLFFEYSAPRECFYSVG